MAEYPKINTLYKRDFENNGVIMPGTVVNNAYLNIRRWRVAEKIDGTNIRIEYSPNLQEVRFRGRTEAAKLYKPLVEFLEKTFTVELLQKKFPPTDDDSRKFSVTLYGEGIGPKVHKGATDYSKESSFIMFDVKIDKWWLEPENMMDIANFFCVRYAPDLGTCTLTEAIDFVKTKPKSLAAVHNEDRVMEGVVIRPEQMLLMRDGEPMTIKIKVRDFEQYERMKEAGEI